jgi:hypothetical protein
VLVFMVFWSFQLSAHSHSHVAVVVFGAFLMVFVFEGNVIT